MRALEAEDCGVQAPVSGVLPGECGRAHLDGDVRVLARLQRRHADGVHCGRHHLAAEVSQLGVLRPGARPVVRDAPDLGELGAGREQREIVDRHILHEDGRERARRDQLGRSGLGLNPERDDTDSVYQLGQRLLGQRLLGLHAVLAAVTHHKVQRRLLTDVVVGQRAPVLELLAPKDQLLLVGRDALLVVDLLLQARDRVARLDLERDRLAVEHLHEDLHAAARPHKQVHGRRRLHHLIQDATGAWGHCGAQSTLLASRMG